MTPGKWPYLTPGIPDEEFIQGRVPLTKEEVRSVALSKTRLREDHIIYDIGAGTGSLSIEAALLAPRGKVFAIERNPEALDLVRQNRERFQVENLTLLPGQAPEALVSLPTADRIIIGGSGGRLPEILEVSAKKLGEGGMLTLLAVTLDTLTAAQRILEEEPWTGMEMVQLVVTRGVKVGKFRILKALNPVFILTASLKKVNGL